MKKFLFPFLFLLLSTTSFAQNYFLAEETADKTYLADYIKNLIENGKFRENPVIVVNENVLSEEELDQFNFRKSDIVNMYIIEKDTEKMVDIYGQQSLYGILFIETKPTDEPVTDQKILYLIDDTPVTKEDIGKLDPTDIRSIELVRDKEKIAGYTNEDYDGIVIINMKR